MKISKPRLTALFAVVLIAACSSEASKGSNAGSKAASARTNSQSRVGATAKADDSAAGNVDLGSSSYKPGPMGASGAVSGTIRLDGTPRVDAISVSADQKVCGTSTAGPVAATAKGISNALVWIADVKTGKPLPMDKRVELASEDCIVDPRVQATVVGSAVDVFNDDKLLHRLVFVRAGTHDTLTVMPFFNEGQIVASDRLATKPGIVEVTCARHPWTHGYIAVFDHPYYAVTDKDGHFTIDALPAGTYKMMVWHEGMAAPTQQSITVAAGGSASADLAVKIP